MLRTLIFGNSGSGKSTLARRLADLPGVAHLDLDTVAWKPSQPGVRETLHTSFQAIDAFIADQHEWVMEGCYTTLLDYAADDANEILFLNLSVPACLANCRHRSWEPHKYPALATQNENLEMLLKWVANYPTRDDEFSLQEHLLFFDSFDGSKTELKSNHDALAKAEAIIATRLIQETQAALNRSQSQPDPKL